MTERTLAVHHAVHAIELRERARGDETSPFFHAGNEAMATARDEARQIGIAPTVLEREAHQARAKEATVLGESFPNVAPKPALPERDAFGFPYQPTGRRRGW